MRLLAAEGQQLPGERRAARGRLQDVLHAFPLTSLGRQRLQHQLPVALDHAEQVVEVVGDAPGELADRLHLLRLAQALLGGAPGAALGVFPQAAADRGPQPGQAMFGDEVAGALPHRLHGLSRGDYSA
jgi:hypothetical protein